MAVGLSEADRELQARTRTFADEELIPWEVHAEMNNGEIPTTSGIATKSWRATSD